MVTPTSARQERPRCATSVSLDPRLIEEARSLDVNVLRACEHGLIEQIRVARRVAENGGAIAASDAFADKQGLPLASAHLF